MKDNMNGKVSWNVFAYRFEDREQVTFEELCYQLFCRKFDLKEGLHRFYNQHYIETDPARISETRVVGFQAKYFESKVINDNQKRLLKETIEKAAVKYPEMTELFFFITSEFSESSKPDQTKTEGQIAIEECAREHGIKLEWVMRSNLEVILQGEEYRSIWNYYFNPDPAVEVSNKTDFKEFYEYAIDKITTYKRNSLYGDISLEDGYIDPYIIDGERIKLKDYLFNWVADKNTDIENRVLIIYGEPGHGKTSLCYKAMYDYIKEGWLSYIVDNVFCFSLNPSDTELNPRDKFDLKKVLCWGDLRENHVSIKSCKNALVFLDGFDELLDSIPNLKLSELIQGPVFRFVKTTNARVVITTRRMSIERELNSDLRIIDAIEYPTFELQPMSYNQQVEWIEKYASYCEKKAGERDDIGSDLVKKASDLKHYLQKYKAAQKDLSAKTKELLAIPIIFRIMVEFQYDPYEFTDSAKLYEDLFNLTWNRRAKLISESGSANKKELTLANIAKHALRCYENDSDSALADIGLKDSDFFWTYQFYTKSIGTKERYNSKKAPQKLRIGFIHRSFYQFFLAKYIILAILDSRSKDELKAFMAHLTRNRLDNATLKFLKELFGLLSAVDQEYVRDRLEQIYQIIGDTDAILKETDEMEWVNTDAKSGIVSKLEAGNILFWNTLSLCSLLECRFDSKYREIYAFRCYSLADIDLSNSCFEGVNLEGADLRHANLIGTDLNRSILVGSNLYVAELIGAKLIGANMRETDLRMVNLNRANMNGADLREANLSNAQIRRADLRGANMNGANLYRADLRRADLGGANLNEANMNGVNLGEADLRGANLRGANLRGANLNGANMNGADLREADLEGANLNGANMNGADLRRTDIQGTCLVGAKLMFKDISGATIDLYNKSWISPTIMGYKTIFWKNELWYGNE